MRDSTKFDPVDYMVDNDGYWRIIYQYNNFGDPYMFLIPYHDSEDGNLHQIALSYLLDGYDFEGEGIIRMFCEDRPNTPFIVSAKSMTECINIMNDRLSKGGYIPEHPKVDGFDFFEECEEFDIFLNACLKITEDPDDKYLYQVFYKSKTWREIGLMK